MNTNKQKASIRDLLIPAIAIVLLMIVTLLFMAGVKWVMGGQPSEYSVISLQQRITQLESQVERLEQNCDNLMPNHF